MRRFATFFKRFAKGFFKIPKVIRKIPNEFRTSNRNASRSLAVILCCCEKVPLLLASNEGSVLKVLDIKSVEHKRLKRKLLLAEDGTVYKVKRPRAENNVEAGQYV